MRQIIAVTTVALALVGTAAAGGSLSGNYGTTIKGKASALNGTWVLEFQTDGSYAIARDGVVVVRGKDTIAASRITFGHEKGPYACLGKLATGTYGWSRKGSKLTLKSVNDRCPGRKAILSSKPFTKT